MSQGFQAFPASEKIRESRPKIEERTETLRSNFAGDTAPTDPAPVEGQHWLDTSVDPGVLKRWNGSSWVAVDGIPASYLDTASTLGGGSPSDTKVPSQKAVKDYADQLLAASDAEVFKGGIDCSTNPNYPAASAGHIYRVTVAGKIGGGSGPNVEINDRLECITDNTSSGTHASVGSHWIIGQANIDGAVIGPPSVTDSHFAQFDGTTGKLIKGGISLDTDATLAANSDTRLASQKAVKGYVDSALAALGFGVLANATYLKGRNQANNADLNMVRVNAQNFIEFGTRRSWDNTNTHTDLGALEEQSVYTNLTPTTMHFAKVWAVVGKGDNSGFKGVGALYCIVRDDTSVDTNGERGVLYGMAFSVRPNVSRSNAPADDVAAIVIQNDGPGKGTEGLYFGANGNGTPPSRDWEGAIGIQCKAVCGIWLVSDFDNGIDFSRGLASPATFTGAAIRVPNATTALSARNQANNADLALIRTNSSNVLIVGGSGVGSIQVANLLTPSTDDGAALGTTSLQFSDLFIASGGVINFNAGDVTVTHSSNLLAFAGASSGYSFDALIRPASSDGAALGSTTLMWSDLFLAAGAVVNFNNGDVTITHGTNTLAFGGAASGYSFDAPTFQADGSQSAPSYSFTNATGYGMYCAPGSGLLVFSVGGAARFWGSSTGVTVGGSIIPSSNDVAPLGSASFSWADLFLADGGTINFNNSNLIVTHSTGKLKVGGRLAIAPGASVTPSTNGDIELEFTSNTSVTVKGKGSDGTVRSSVLTLA